MILRTPDHMSLMLNIGLQFVLDLCSLFRGNTKGCQPVGSLP